MKHGPKPAEKEGSTPTVHADDTAAIPALFATIHFRSAERPDGYTADEITAINEKMNPPTGGD